MSTLEDMITCVCMSQHMVHMIQESCPHVAHRFHDGCMTMNGVELQEIGETCEGLRGSYL